jgi:8-amino-7-oxononanoate synthase
MDADVPRLAELSQLCRENGAAFYVDEAHALGVFGPNGRGACAAAGVVPDVLVGTFGKSFGLAGAFVGGKEVVRKWLWNRARAFVFSTGMSPVLAAEARRRLPSIAEADAERTHLLSLADRLRSGLRALGCDARGEGPIVPWVLSDPAHAVRMPSMGEATSSKPFGRPLSPTERRVCGSPSPLGIV